MYNSYYGYPNFTNIPLRSAPMSYIPTRSLQTPLLSSRISPLLTRAATPTALQTATKSFSWSNLLNGASRTLGVINQAIPVVNQVKPVVNNVKTMFKVVKELNKTDTKTTTNQDINKTESKQDNIQKNNKVTNDNQPKFFV